MRARFIASEVWQGLRRNSSMALAVVIVTFVSFTFVGAAVLLQAQVGKLKDDWFDKVEVSIFLCPAASLSPQCQQGPATDDQIAGIEQVLTTGTLGALVETVHFEDKQQAYQKLRERNPDDPFVGSLTPDDMQPSFRVKLKDPTQFQIVSDATGQLPGVETVVDQRDVFKDLFLILNRATLIAASLAVVMLLAAVLLITTTIRLSALSRRRETAIMRMVGASKSLIQLPFMLEGALAATTGALLTITGLWVSVRYLLQDWLGGGGGVSFVNYVGPGDVLAMAPWMLLIAFALAGVSSVFTLRRYTTV